ncbi:hypothetical protein DSM104443_01773 [Usitatibacter rugosus]|uniref:NHL repeat-containing protein n=1 Tax=Usitatibacter rugosus TaxID=2732067 RepID=A0A6M4GUM6_9PROT|nr:hypothetical protein [Usitatibacter rugosus]QJR10705.1 hypothetical protein DSM104443_01773 [Usitatibacter rugosus]
MGISRTSMKWLAAATMAVAVSSCGGDGGNDGPPPPPPPVVTLESVAVVDGRHMAADRSGNLYTFGPTGNGLEFVVTKITPSGAIVRLFVVVANPGAIATDAAGNVYVGDNQFCSGIGDCTRNPVSIFQKIATDGTVTPIPVVKSSDQSDMDIRHVTGIAVDAAGSLYFSDGGRATIRKLTPDGDLTAVAGMPGVSYEADGVGREARFANPVGIAIDAAGNLFVGDTGGNTIRKVTPTGIVTTVAGLPFVSGYVDGPPSIATFRVPYQVAVDARGNVYVADGGSALIRKVSPAGVVSTVAGTGGVLGFQAGPAPGVIDRPYGIAIVGNDLFFTQAARIAAARNAASPQ